MNNKGMTLVEVIVSFALLMIIVIGMLSTIMIVRTNYNEKKFQKEYTEFRSTLVQEIETDLIKNGFTSLQNCATSSSTETCKILTFKDGTTKELNINLKTATITYGASDTKINYQIPNYKYIEFLDSRVMYNPPISADVEIKVQTGTINYLIINVPYFEIDKHDKNLGFKIVYPINL